MKANLARMSSFRLDTLMLKNIFPISSVVTLCMSVLSRCWQNTHNSWSKCFRDLDVDAPSVVLLLFLRDAVDCKCSSCFFLAFLNSFATTLLEI